MSIANLPASSASRRRRAPASPARSARNGSSTSTSARVDCGHQACGFIQDLCRNTLGPERGKLIVLRPWQHEILHGLFDKAGKPRHRYGYIGLPRKNGKSTLGAALAIYALVCLGPASHVYSCAGDRKQASIVFDEAKRMVRAEPELTSLLRVQRWHIEGPQDGIYRVLSADAELQQGLNPTFVIFDEVHVQPNRDLWDAMVLGMVRPGAMIVGITTAGFDRTTLAWDLYERGQRGEFFYSWSEPADPNCDWRDPAAWREANPALGDFLPTSVVEADVTVTPESAFRRFHLNQWTTTHSAWLPHGAWVDRKDEERAFDPAEPFVAFLDGSWSNDSTGLVSCTLALPHLAVRGLWTPDLELGHIDMAAIERTVRDVLGMPGCRAMAFDPARFQDLFARLEAEFPGRIFEWPTNSLARMVPACADFYAAVMEKRLTHDGDPRLAQHLANAVLREDHRGGRIVKESKTSQRKIDLAVCAVGAYSEALRMALVPLETSVYDTRPPLTF
jgi:phage terminase large subunit-like protein